MAESRVLAVRVGPHRPAGFLRRMLGTATQRVAWGVVLLLVAIAILAPLIAPYDPNRQDLVNTLQTASSHHLLGTDNLGRDLLSRLIYGLRCSLSISTIVAVGAATFGVPLGVLAGYTRGALNTLIARLIDVGLALPALVLALGLIAAMGAGTKSTTIALIAGYSPYLARVTRSVVLRVRQEDYISSAIVSGVPPWRIAIRHVAPNMIEAVSVQLTLILAFAVIAEAGLSFVGLGVQPPTSSLGNMLALGAQYSVDRPLISIVPGITIAVLVISLLFCGDGVRTSLDPRRRG